MAVKKRKKSARKKHSKTLFVLFSLVVALLPLVAYLGYEAYNKHQSNTHKQKLQKQEEDKIVQKMRDLLEKEKLLETKTPPLETPHKENNTSIEEEKITAQEYYLSEAKDYATSLAQIEYEDKEHKDQTPLQFDPKNPKMIIIIDDISFEHQVKMIQDTNMKLSMSYLPPNKRHPQSATIAKKDPHALLHLPLEAFKHNSPETKTLMVSDSKNEIENTIKTYRNLYPNVTYVNNHTGSKFTSDLKAMKRLLEVLKQYNFVFIDSKTTANSKAMEASKGIQERMLQRNVFLDNKPEIAYIQGQLKQAIKIAQKTGFSIAIGHPHKATIDALQSSKNLLEDITLIYPDEL